MGKTSIAIKLLITALALSILAACNAQNDLTGDNRESTVAPVENPKEALNNNATMTNAPDNSDTIFYENLSLGFTLELPASLENKYIIKENDFNLLGDNSISIYHKATVDEKDNAGWLGSFGRAQGYYTVDQPPVMSGWCPILEYKNGFTYYYNSPSDVQYSADEDGLPITDAAKEYVEMQEQLKGVTETLIALDTWITPDDSIDKSGMNLYWHNSITGLFKGENAKILLYTSAEMDGKNNFIFSDSQDWLLLMETSFGVYPLFPRLPVQLGKVSCRVFNSIDNHAYDTTTVLVTVEQAASHVTYECVFDSERKAFKIASVYNKHINTLLKDANTVNEIFGFDESLKTKFPLIAKLPEKNIYLYGINPQGVVLYNDITGQFFDWNYLTPRGILPQIASADFNRDGVEEIGVSLYCSSGTGLSIEQLHVLETGKDKFGDNHYIDYEFMETDYLEQLKDILKYKYTPETKLLALQINNEVYEYQCAENFKELNYSAIIDFEFENDGIKGIFHLGVVYKDMYTYDYKLGALVADIIYENGKFILSNPTIDEAYAFPM